MGKANLAASLKFKDAPIDAKLYNDASRLLRGFGYKPWENYPPVGELLAKHNITKKSQIAALEYYFSDAPKAAIAKADALKSDYFRQFPNIPVFIQECIKRAKFRGYSITLTKRRRHFKKPKEEAYKAPNATIQGGCGDITKRKMWECKQLLAPYKSRVINNIHDALLFEIHKDELFLIPMIRDIMVDLPFKIPFEVSVEVSDVSWAHMEEVDCAIYRN